MMPFKSNTILLKTVGVVCVVIAALILVQVITSHKLFISQFSGLEEQEMVIKMQQAVSELKGSLQKIETITRDWAPWDETYGFVQGENPSFVADNLADAAFINLNIDFIVLIDTDNQLIYTQFFDQTTGKKVAADATVTRAIGKEILQGLGYRVTTFTLSLEALRYLNEHGQAVDLVISDLTMPKLTGIDLAKALQQQQAQLPVLLCTGHNEGLTEEDLQTIGIDAVILKPITMHNLARQVRATLDKGSVSSA